MLAADVAARAADDADRAPWLRGRAAAGVAAAVTLGLVAMEVVATLGLDLRVRREHGVTAYAGPESVGPPVMVLVVALALVLAGVAAGRWQGWWWLLVGSLVMTAGSAAPAPSRATR